MPSVQFTFRVVLVDLLVLVLSLALIFSYSCHPFVHSPTCTRRCHAVLNHPIWAQAVSGVLGILFSAYICCMIVSLLACPSGCVLPSACPPGVLSLSPVYLILYRSPPAHASLVLGESIRALLWLCSSFWSSLCASDRVHHHRNHVIVVVNGCIDISIWCVPQPSTNLRTLVFIQSPLAGFLTSDVCVRCRLTYDSAGHSEDT